MTTTTRGGTPRVFLRKVGHFLWHYLQMCMACCVGGVTLGVAFFGGAALIGYPELIVQAPVFSTWRSPSSLRYRWWGGCAFAITGGGPHWRWGPRRWGWGLSWLPSVRSALSQ